MGHAAGPEVINGKLQLRYLGGSPCQSNPAVNSSARIEFVCSKQPGVMV